MRMSTKGGATPRDRRLDRGKVAIAALAVLFLFATNAQANVVEFKIVPELSFLKFGSQLSAKILGGTKTGVPQYAGSNTTTYYGSMYVDIQETTIQLLPGASVSAAIGAPGAGGVPGRYAPWDPVISDPVAVPPTGTTPPGDLNLTDGGNYGEVTDTGAGPAVSILYNIRLDNGWIDDPNNQVLGVNAFPSTPMALAGENFNLAGQAMSYSQGNFAIYSVLGAGTGRIGQSAQDVIDGESGDPTLFFGTAGTDIGSWDGFTLTIPVHSTFSFILDEGLGVTQTQNVEGFLVLVPAVPEPATMTLFGLGIVGLLSYALRTRKRKA